MSSMIIYFFILVQNPNFFKAWWRDVLVEAYYGPEAGQPKGQNVAVSEARDGEANETERICRLPADGHENGNLK